MDITTQTIEHMRLMAYHHSGPYQEIGPVFGKLYQWAHQNGAPIGLGVAVYYDDPTEVPAAELRSNAGIVIPPGYEPAGDDAPSIVSIEGGRYAVATHMGSYEGLGDAWHRFMGGAIAAAGYELIPAPCFEMYMNDCESVPIEEVRTDLYARIK
jgi:AraC family transcriptional regulator